MRYLIKLSYDGSKYHGYQRQPGLNTIQEYIEKSLTKINNGKTTYFHSSGRTDRGVHAYSQYGHADIDVDINEYKLKRALNSNLPKDIYVIETKQVEDNFHARYNVKEKTYQYLINIGEYNPIQKDYIFQYNYKLDIDNMSKAITYLIGTHDYRFFVTENNDKENCTRTIFNATIEEDNNIVKITFQGTGFLRYQVRNMVGTLIQVGENKISPETVDKMLQSKDRSNGGKTAPSEGLYLMDVIY